MIALSASYSDPLIIFISLVAILIIGAVLLLKRIRQPYIIGYILVGAVLGQSGFGLIDDTTTINHLGEIGIILLLFFIGMEINLPDFIKQWKVAAVGTSLQVLLSIGFLLAVGYLFNWQIQRSIILGFVIALSSSAVIIKLLSDKKLTNTRIGKNVLSILLMQDIIIVPLLIISALLGGQKGSPKEILLNLIGGAIIILALVYIYKNRSIKLPFSKAIEKDHELQVFLAILFCFGGALGASIFGLSPALGAFVGGMIMHASKATHWIFDTLNSFRILFVAVFFISVGLQLDFSFILDHIWPILVVLLCVYITNHLINSFILRLFSCSWPESILGGALLAQIGELSFLIITAAYSMNIVESYSYKFAISLISLTLIISPFWISLSEYFIALYEKKKHKES